jgi:ribosome biogenesis GTPase
MNDPRAPKSRSSDPSPEPARIDALRRIGCNDRIASVLAARPDLTGALARVLERHRDRCSLDDGRAVHDAGVHPALPDEDRAALAVGDWVLTCDDGGTAWIRHRLPAYGAIHRIEPSGARQALVANVDVAFLVMGLDGDFNPRRLERHLALAKTAGVLPVVVLTKADLCADADARLDELRARLPSPVDRIALNATDPAAVHALRVYVTAGTTAVLLGSSGAGKSTLTNALCGADVQKTGGVRESDSRGRHTTTGRHLVRLADGGCLIDTPGLRGLRLDVDESALTAAFEDIAVLASACRFRDCAHQEEPGCAVRAGVSADRLANFHKLRREIAHDRSKPLVMQAKKAEMKIRHRALRAMQKDRRR